MLGKINSDKGDVDAYTKAPGQAAALAGLQANAEPNLYLREISFGAP
jgi:hypothetical protein